MEATAGGRKMNCHHTSLFFLLQAPSPSLNTPSYTHISCKKKKNKTTKHQQKTNQKNPLKIDPLYLVPLATPLKNKQQPFALSYESSSA